MGSGVCQTRVEVPPLPLIGLFSFCATSSSLKWSQAVEGFIKIMSVKHLTRSWNSAQCKCQLYLLYTSPWHRGCLTPRGRWIGDVLHAGGGDCGSRGQSPAGCMNSGRTQDRHAVAAVSRGRSSSPVQHPEVKQPFAHCKLQGGPPPPQCLEDMEEEHTVGSDWCVCVSGIG